MPVVALRQGSFPEFSKQSVAATMVRALVVTSPTGPSAGADRSPSPTIGAAPLFKGMDSTRAGRSSPSAATLYTSGSAEFCEPVRRLRRKTQRRPPEEQPH